MSETITIVCPDIEEIDTPARPTARRSPIKRNARIVLIDNGKPRAKDLLQMIADELRARKAVGSVEIVSKSTAVYPITSDVANGIAERADVVIAGLGDCGACSACSLHDAIQMENLGVPSTVLISDAFIGNVGRFAVNLGSPGYHSLVVPHPVASKSDAQLRKLAANVADAACDQLFDTRVFAEAS